MYRTISQIYIQGGVIIFNFFKHGLQLVVLEILAINLIALFCTLKTFLRFLTFPQNKTPYFKDECMYAKYKVLTIFLFTNDYIDRLNEENNKLLRLDS
jgi:hypothetical protein